MAKSWCAKVFWTLFITFLLVAGVSEIVLGSLNLDQCPAKPILPIWMIMAGATLVLMASLLLFYFLCSWCQLIKNFKLLSDKSPTLGAVFCACTCGIVGVFISLVWLGLWICGSYFVLNVISEMRTFGESHSNKQQDCDLASVIVSGGVILSVWVMFVCFLIYICCVIFKMSEKSRNKPSVQKNNKLDNNHIYDLVAEEEAM